MRLLILTLTILITPVFLNAQNLRQDSLINKNNISIELGGVGVIGSINYERLIKVTKNKLLFRVGVSYLPLTVNNKPAFGTPILPFGLYYLIGNKHNLELGLNNSLGYTFGDNTNNHKFNYLLMPSIGYRFENFMKKSINFSFAYSPCMNISNKSFVFQNWIKISFGYAF
jgi:hypothetical protein